MGGLKLNVATTKPTVMHIDLNSCFAIIEQQANRLLRGRPVGVAAYDTPRGFVLAASYEAKALGVKLGVNVAQARQMCPNIVIMTPDPPKYREAHKRFKDVLLAYTDDVTPKSIDEFVVHLENAPLFKEGISPEAIGYQIKNGIYESLGEAVTVNVGIGPNRFLAKLAAGLHKPNGLDTITHENLRAVYEELDLLDLPGINTRYKRRLEAFGIKTPLQFLDAEEEYLRKRVFKSVVGQHWYMRLRGYEPDRRVFGRKSIGHQHAMSKQTADPEELQKVLMKLCEKAGRRLRKNNLYAGGIHLWMSFAGNRNLWSITGADAYAGQRTGWHHGEKVASRLRATHDIYTHAKRLLESAKVTEPVRLLAVTVFDLHEFTPEQLDLFGSERGYLAARRISDALDAVNNRYGEFVVTPATMLSMRGVVLDRIAFGNIRDL
jgi:DNA polymerase-4